MATHREATTVQVEEETTTAHQEVGGIVDTMVMVVEVADPTAHQIDVVAMAGAPTMRGMATVTVESTTMAMVTRAAEGEVAEGVRPVSRDAWAMVVGCGYMVNVSLLYSRPP